MKRRLLFVPLILCAVPAAAQLPAAPKWKEGAEVGVPPAARKAAAELVTLLDLPAQMRADLERQLAPMRAGTMLSRQIDANPALRRERERNPAAFDAAVRKVSALQVGAYEGVIRDTLPEVTRLAVGAYARNFTAQELRALAAFYRTPFGARVRTRLPIVNNELGLQLRALMAPRLQTAMRDVAPQIIAEMQKLVPEEEPPAQ